MMTAVPDSRKSLSCLLMAAGQSKRMGASNKLLLPIEGKSVVRRSAESLKRLPFKEIIAVTGFESPMIEAELESLGIGFVHNENFPTGMHSSIRAGILALSDTSHGFVVVLADQPWIDDSVFHRLIDEFSLRTGPRILTSWSDGKRGNPTIISSDFIPEILAEPDGDYGCSYLFKRHPNVVVEVQVQDPGILIDIDTPEDYRIYRQGIPSL
jgi:molybdenum cofactor cytidylyltransferase